MALARGVLSAVLLPCPSGISGPPVRSATRCDSRPHNVPRSFRRMPDTCLWPVEPAMTTTPRKSLIVVLVDEENNLPEEFTRHLRTTGGEGIQVIVACAGPTHDLALLQHTVGDAQYLIAPPGTNAEDLRELAMTQAAGDIVTVLSRGLTSPTPQVGPHIHDRSAAECSSL